MHLLVGFVNQVFTPQLCMGLLDTKSEKFLWIMDKDIESRTEKVWGLTGVIQHHDKIIAAFQSSPTKLVVFNKDFSIHNVYTLPGLENVHSFCKYGDHLLCVSTGTDEVYELFFDFNIAVVGCRLLWQYGAGRLRQDLHHLSSVAHYDGNTYITCFGAKHSLGWSHTTNGELINITKNKILLKNLQHPHTVHFSNGQWMLCESKTGSIRFKNAPPLQVGGYTRGIAEDDTCYYIGSSGKRLISRSQGTVNLEAASNRFETQSHINIVDKSNLQLLGKITIGEWGTEIFDLLCLDDVVISNHFQNYDPREQQLHFLGKRIMQLQQGPQQQMALAQRSKHHLLKKIKRGLKRFSK